MEPSSAQQTEFTKPPCLNELVEGISFEEYANAEGMNSSGIKEILEFSPAHFYEHKFNKQPEEKTDALQFGKLFHFAVLEPEKFKANYVVVPKVDRRTKLGKESHQKFIDALKSDAIQVPEEDLPHLTKMCEKLMNHPRASKILSHGLNEATMWWNDRETGELCKMRADFVSPAIGVVDLKTSRDAHPDRFYRDVEKYWYHVQAAHYIEGGRVTKTFRTDSFTFIVIEKKPPYAISVLVCADSMIQSGDRWRSKAMQIYAKCRRTGVWDAYGNNARVIEMRKNYESRDSFPEEI